MNKIALFILLSSGWISATPVLPTPPLYGPPKHNSHHPQPHPQTYEQSDHKIELKPYAFDYGVSDEYTGTNFGHEENSDGNSVKGSYTVALPDGRIQKVNYVADHLNGFQAEVTYEGEATYPAYKQREDPPQYENVQQPTYNQPQRQIKHKRRYKSQQVQNQPDGSPNYQGSVPQYTQSNSRESHNLQIPQY